MFVAVVLLSGFLYSPSATSVKSGQRPIPLMGHWRVTESQTLWTGRYSNDDYGYLVLLGDGVVAHGSHPPSPNHGFFIPLPDVGKTTFTWYKTEKRYIEVDASYNSFDGAVDHTLMAGEDDASDGVKRSAIKLAGLPATMAIRESSTPNGNVVDESVVVLRCGIVYTIALHTLQSDREVDEGQFLHVRNGFRWLKLPKNECGNP